MGILAWVGMIVFVAGYSLITLEHKINTHRSAVALITGTLLWVLVACSLRHDTARLANSLESTGSELFSIVAFLLAAMALIEILVHYRLFDLIRARLSQLHIGEKQLFLTVTAITFLFSSVLDNIAITIAMLQIARRFFTGKNLLIVAAGIVIAANAGGAWSPIGDVTTILLWLNDKFTAAQIITSAFIPALTLWTVSMALLYRRLDVKGPPSKGKSDIITLATSEKVIIGAALGSFSLPLLMSTIGLPPYMGLLLGLGITWALTERAKHKNPHNIRTHSTVNLEHIVQTIDIASIKYLIGILLGVTALAALGVLSAASTGILGAHPDTSRLITANIGLGMASSVLDNASLVAMAIGLFPAANSTIWTLTALAAGTGGSILIIASAAGIVAMGSVKELTFQRYLKLATVPAAAGFVSGIAVWLLQYRLFFS